MARDPETDLLLANGIELFNEGYFFEAHELLEGLWTRDRSPSRAFYQGLIQVASAYHHCGRGNYRGALDLLTRGANRLRPYGPSHLGVDVEDLLRNVERDAAIAERLQTDETNPERVVPPKIRLRPDPQGADG